MNLNVQEAGENQTEVDVNVRYVVIASGTRGTRLAQWSFNTGGSDTQASRS